MNKKSPPVRQGSTISSTGAVAEIASLLLICTLTGCATGIADSLLNTRSTPAPPPWRVVKVELPVSNAYFPAGDGADVANGQCLICHSAGMVLRQPPLTQKEWVGEINKMRNAFGAPLPADQVEPLAKYLFSINGGQTSGVIAAPDSQVN